MQSSITNIIVTRHAKRYELGGDVILKVNVARVAQK